MRNWPGYSGSGTAAIVQVSEPQEWKERRAFTSAEFYSSQEQREPLGRQA
jgi:hypothetical protein